MDIKEFINNVCKEIKYEPIRKGIGEELTSHIQDIKEEYISKGIEEKEAEEKAVSQMGIAEDIGRNLNKIHRPKLDWQLLILIITLIGFGIFVAILKQPLMNDNYVGSTITYMFIGIILSIGVYFFDYKKIRKYSNVIYLLASIIMILPIFMGVSINGSQHYIVFFSSTIFPPMVALPLYVIAFVGYIINYDKDNIFKVIIFNEAFSINKNFIKILICSLISLFLMLYFPSITNGAILGISYLVISTIKIVQDRKKRVKNLITLYGILLLLGGFIFVTLMMGSPFRFERIITSFNPEADPGGSGYIGMLQKEVLENAKIIGEADTRVISSDEYIVSIESNYTFIYLLGKTGLLVAGLLVLTIVLTSIKLILNARNIKEQYGRYLIIGLSTLYILQSFATILMNVNMGIQTNVNLPFVTYGGVYFIVNILTIAIILSVYRRKDINLYEERVEKKYEPDC